MNLISPQKSPWVILFAMVILIMLINVDYTAVNIAMVGIAEEIKVELNTLQWLLSGYVLAWAAFVIPGGRLADIYGKRRMLLWGVSIFMVSSIICGAVNSTQALIASRVAQGFGGALFVPPVYSLLFDVFPEDKRGFAIGMMGVGAGIGLAIGPSFGGFLMQTLGWRWIFFINGPLCFIVIVAVMMCVKKEPARLSQAKLDLLGSMLLAFSLATGIYTLNQTEVWGLSDKRIWVFFAVAIGLAVTFTLNMRGKENRLIPEGLLKNRAFLGTMIGFSIYAFSFSVVLVIIGLFLQNVLGYSAYEAGIIFLAMTISLGILSPYGGKLTDSMDARVPICGGLFLLTCALIAAGFMDDRSHLYTVATVLLLVGLGMGLAFPALNAAMMKTVDSSMLSTASGTFTMSCCSFNTVGVVVSTSLLVGIGRVKMDRFIELGQTSVDARTQEALVTLLSSAYRDMNLLNFRSAEDIQVLVTYLNSSFVNSMSFIMWITAGLTMLATITSYKMIIVKKSKSSD